jgi:gamma-glutamyltranspeptidase/glutathione hydrolase
MLLATAGCHPGKPMLGLSGHGAADDPRAVEVGRAVMEGGGSAADAAVAMALTMAVTLPSRVGLGGGGLCLVHDPATKAVRTLDFLPESTSAGGAPAPGFLRGLYTLHAAYGLRHWEEALGAPESLAGLGTPVSRQLAADLRLGAGRLAADAGARRLFLSADGRPLAEGETLVQTELAATLGLIRQRGIATFYGGNYGATGSTLAEALAHGLGVDAAALAGLRPRWGDTVAVENDNDMIHFPDRTGAGLAAAWQAGVAAGDGDWFGAMVGALGAGTVGAGVVPTASLAVVDPHEQGVACVFTMGGLFGSGRVVPEAGLLAAGGEASGSGGPVLVVNHHQETTLFAAGASAPGTGTDSRAGAAAVLAALHLSAIDHRPAADILAPPPSATAQPAVPGLVEAVACVYDHQQGGKSCGAVADPRGPGVTFTVLK